MKIAVIIIRTLMGLMFLLTAIIYFFKLMPPEPEVAGNIKAFNEGVAASGYLMPFIKIVEVLCAILLLIGRYTTLVNVIIFPIVLNIFFFHLFLMPQGLPIAIFLLLGNLFLAYYYRKNYSSLFIVK